MVNYLDVSNKWMQNTRYIKLLVDSNSTDIFQLLHSTHSHLTLDTCTGGWYLYTFSKSDVISSVQKHYCALGLVLVQEG